MSETDLSAQVDAICRENERLTERVAALESELAKVRELAAAVVRSHDAPGGCRGPVGWTAMQSLSDHLSGWELQESTGSDSESAALLMNSALPLCAEVERLREVERLALTLVTASATARDCAETFMRRRRVEESPPLSVCHEWPEHAAMTAAWAAEREAMSALTAAVRR